VKRPQQARRPLDGKAADAFVVIDKETMGWGRKAIPITTIPSCWKEVQTLTPVAWAPACAHGVRPLGCERLPGPCGIGVARRSAAFPASARRGISGGPFAILVQPMNASEFDKFAEEYRSLHQANIAASGEAPEYFAEYKMKDLRRLVSADSGRC